MNIKDSFCNKHCRISLHDVGGKLVQTLDSGVGWGWGWGRGNLHGNGDGDGEFFVGTGCGWGIFHGDGMGMGKILWGWGQFYLPCHSVVSTKGRCNKCSTFTYFLLHSPSLTYVTVCDWFQIEGRD